MKAAAEETYVVKLMYEIVSDERFLHINRGGWSWAGELDRFDCTIGSTTPPLHVVTSSSPPGAAASGTEPNSGPGPTLIATPRFQETAIEKAKAALEELLCAWAAHLEVTENLAIRFEYRGAWVTNPQADDPTPVLADQAAGGGETIEVFKLLGEAPSPPPTWMTREPDLVRMLREQWRGYRSGEAKLLDRAYFCLTAIEATYGGRKRAAETLCVSGALLSRIGRLAASQDREHARKLTGGGPTTLSAEDREWLNSTIPRLILRCAEIELGRSDIRVLQMEAPAA
jgi:hypothetical protein